MELTLSSEEKLLVGGWVTIGDSVKLDKLSYRVDWLITKYLIKVHEDESGWSTLFADPKDGRYWELTYPTSETHGGGSCRLENISISDAEMRYKLFHGRT